MPFGFSEQGDPSPGNKHASPATSYFNQAQRPDASDLLEYVGSSPNLAVCHSATNHFGDHSFASFECSPMPCKWLHSVLNEVDFCDEWTALDRAFHLAFEIYPPDLHNFKVARNGSLSNFEHRHRDNAVGTVRFKDEVELFIGLERSNL